ncbi:MAG: ATP-binding protein [Syntrophales bacterium]|nr:ATP-binding protein [Syntrophales bacterium]
MIELSLHILDIVENSTRAGAGLVTIRISEDRAGDRFRIEIEDDGEGMDDETARQALDPFFTTKTVRRFGLGLPMLRHAAERAEGGLEVKTLKGKETKVNAEFRLSHIDRQPLGDIAATIAAVIAGNPRTDFIYRHESGSGIYVMDTREVRRRIGDVPIDNPKILNWIKSDIESGLEGIGIDKSA